MRLPVAGLSLLHVASNQAQIATTIVVVLMCAQV